MRAALAIGRSWRDANDPNAPMARDVASAHRPVPWRRLVLWALLALVMVPQLVVSLRLHPGLARVGAGPGGIDPC